MLEKVIERFPQLKLIVLDTFCEHLRSNELSFAEKKRTVSLSLMGLQRIAAKFGICVVVVNNMRPGRKVGQWNSDFGKEGQPGGLFANQPPAKPLPLFGEDLFQCVTSRVLTERD